MRLRSRSDDGVAAVEFALVLPLLSALVFGLIEFALAFNAQLTIQHAAREGVRVFSITKDGAKATTAATNATTAAKFKPEHVTVTTYNNGAASTTCTHGGPASVKVTLAHQSITSMFPMVPATLDATGVMRCGG